MTLKRSAFYLVLTAMIFTIVGCNMPISPRPTAFVFPTPDLTMTAIFNPPVVIPPTVTLPVPPTQVEPATPVPTDVISPTSVPPTATTIPPTATVTVSTQASGTNTSVPTNMRSGPSVVGSYMSTPPTIDGIWDEWTARAYPARNVVFGRNNWTNADDLEGSFRAGWDNTNLYLAVKVLDETYKQGATGETIFQGDSIEILLDTNVSGDFFTESLNGDDFQIGISAGNPTPGQNMETYLWYPTSKTGKLTNVKMAAVGSDGVWRLEAAIPWSVFGVTPADGQHYGFGLSVSDNDNTGTNVQQSMVSNITDRTLTDPTTWGDLTLTR